MKKKYTWRGVAGILVSCLSVIAYMSVLAFQREGDINLFLNLNAPEVDGEGEAVYKSAYDSKEDMLAAEKEYLIRSEEEGSVLLKNNNDALPINEGKNITLFGRTSVDPIYRGGSGGANATNAISLYDALKDEGFSINDSVYNALESSTLTRGNGEIAEAPSSIYSGLSFDNYKDAAIVVLGRFGGEANDLDVNDNYNVPELSLHESEKEMLNIVKNAGFKKTIVLLNTAYGMDLGWLDDYDIDACLWIGYPGEDGMIGVARMLDGQASPSGKLADTYATNALSAPSMQNFGNYVFNNLTDQAQYRKEYVVYQEDIYTGYKYYETRYNDQVLNIHDATSSAGVYASANNSWNYADEMGYPFGYGLTYTDFSQTVKSIDWNRDDNSVTAVVNVKNNGSENYQGQSKSVVELYASLPYQEGQAEKSAIQLIGYGKTDNLKAGESQDITIEVSDYLFATYDNKAINGADNSKLGCYTFDAGDYYFAIGDSSHDALNNVLAKKEGNSVDGKLFDVYGNIVDGDSTKVKEFTLDSLDNSTWAKSETGEIVSNQFDDVDINHYYNDEDDITYLSRSDWKTFPKSLNNLNATPEMAKYMTASSALYTIPSDAPDVSSYKYGEEVTTKFCEMAKVDYDDDEAWNDFINQLTIKELCQIPGEKMGNDAVTSVAYPANSSGDGPEGFQSGNCTLHVAEVVSASSFSEEILRLRGQFLAEDCLYANCNMLYGPGANIHRTPYSGRNYEYYSEDSVLSYYCGEYQVSEMSDKGILASIKHFAANDQETNRHGVATFMTEQAFRQGPLKGFEGAFTKGNALATMTAFNRIGVKPAAADYATMTQLLRNEWGFKGINLTDSSKDATTYMFTADCIAAGTDLFNNDSARSSEVKSLLISNRDGYLWGKVRTSAKHFFYAYSRSKLINNLTVNTVVKDFIPWWKPTIIAIDSVLSIAFVGCTGMFVYQSYFKKDKKKKVGKE